MKQNTFGIAVLLFCAALALQADSLPVLPAAAEPPSATLEGQVGVPTIAPIKPTVLEITIVVDGKLVTKKVPVNIAPWVVSPRMPGETLELYRLRLKGDRELASLNKANEIVKAINKAFKDEFTKIGQMAQLDSYLIKDPPYTTGDHVSVFGKFVVPNVYKDPNSKFPYKVLEDDTGESRGDGASFRPGGGGSGSSGSMGTKIGSATGVDGVGDQSIVRLGVEEIYMAEFMPTAGATGPEILLALEGMLDTHGLGATYNPLTGFLTLDDLIADGNTFKWEFTDTGVKLPGRFWRAARAGAGHVWADRDGGSGAAGAAARRWRFKAAVQWAQVLSCDPKPPNFC